MSLSCPICGLIVSNEAIDAHVNACLDGTNQSHDANVPPPSADELLAIALQEEENKFLPSFNTASPLISSSTPTATQCCACNAPVTDSSALFIIDECFHKTHRSCASAFVRASIATAVHVSCPSPGCATLLSVRDLKELVADNDSQSNHLQQQQQHHQHHHRSVVRHDATQRLMSELEHIAKADPQKNGFSVEPINDDLFHWEIRFFGFDNAEPLAADLARVKDHCVTLEATFPPDFPFAPPFIRVMRPRFHYRSGHITLGGSCCMELLTRSGWSPYNTVEAVLVSIRTNLLVGGARVDHQKPDYTLAEAQEAFNRMVQVHGWH